MALPLLARDVKRNPEGLLVLPLIALEPVQFELQILLLVQQLLQPICEDDVRVVQAAVLLVELVVTIVLQIVTAPAFSIFLHILLIEGRLTLLEGGLPIVHRHISAHMCARRSYLLARVYLRWVEFGGGGTSTV